MEKTITINRAELVKEYQAADKKGKALLERLHGKETFAENIIDKVKSFEDACGVLGITVASILSQHDTVDEAAYKKLKTIAKALNQGWTPDWSNDDQAKYYPWFEWSNAKSGVSLYYVGDFNSYSGASSRLCFHSRELAEYFATQFIDLYNDYLTIK